MAERAGSVEVVIKGGRPWGFTLQGGIENRSALTVAQIDPQGKAHKQGVLQVGDHVIKINDVQCLSLADALQLIDCAFRTLTVLIWRSGASSCDKDEPIPRNATYRDSKNQLPKTSTRHSLRVKGSSRKSSSASDPSKCPPGFSTGQRAQKADQSSSEQRSVTNDVVVWGPKCEKSVEIFDCAKSIPTNRSRIQLSPTDHHISSGSSVTGEPLDKRRQRHSSSASTASSCALPSSPKDMVFQTSDHLVLPRHQRSPRKLTKDSGYETSAQGEPDYVNADWITRDKSPPTPASSPDGYLSHRRNGSHCRTPSFSGDESFTQPYPSSGFNRNTQGLYNSHSRDLSVSSYSSGGINRSFSCYSSSESLSLPLQLPPANRLERPSSSRYSSTDSLVSWSSGRGASSLQTATSSLSLALHKGDRCTTTFQSSSSLYHYPDRPLPPPPYQGASLSNLARSTPNLDIDADMVTRRFNKKRSVYEALANKSGLDFSPFIHRQPYWERREVFEGDSTVKNNFGRSRGNSLPAEARDLGGPRSLPVSSTIIEAKDSDSHARASCYRYRRSSQPNQPDSIPTIPEKQSTACPKDRSLSPPSIPTRDSSLRYRANPGHEKYPSWPVTSEVADVNSQVSSSSYRSNSWTQPTDYPKEHNTSYSRPKKLYQISTQQLHPVQEKGNDTSPRRNKSEVVSHHQPEDGDTSDQGLTEVALSKYFSSEEAESYHKPNNGRFQPERDYAAHSPPERDTSVSDRGRDSNKFYDEESYSKKYGDMLRYYSQSPALYGNWSKDSSHSFSCDSNMMCDSNTPLLDRLRLEKQSHLPAWPPPHDTDTPSEAGTCTDSVDSNSSSQETLKWHGSYNDLSSLNARLPSVSVDYDSDHSTIADTGCFTPQMAVATASPESSHKNYVTRSDIQPNHFGRTGRIEHVSGHDKEAASLSIPGNKREVKVLNVQEGEKPIRQSSFSSHVAAHSSPTNGTSSYENRIQKLKEENKNRGVSQAFQTSFPGFSRNAFDETHENNKLQPPSSGRVTNDTINTITKTCDASTSDKVHSSPPHSNFTSERRDSYSYGSHCWSRQKTDDRKEAMHYLDSHKRHRISDPELKAIQKQAVLSFYHRQTALESGDFSDAKSDRSTNSFSPPHHQSTESAAFNHPSLSPRSPTSKEKPFARKQSPALPPKPKQHYSSEVLESGPTSPVRHQANFAKDHFVSNDPCHETVQKIKQSFSSEKLEKSPVSPSKKKSPMNESSFFNTSRAEFSPEHQYYFQNESVKSTASVTLVRPKPSMPLDRNSLQMCSVSHSKQQSISPDYKRKDAPDEPFSPIFQAPTSVIDSSSLQATHFNTLADHPDSQISVPQTQDSSVVDVIYENISPQQSAAKSAHASRELKERAVDQTSSHGILWSHPGGRKAHLKKIYNSNETAVVKVISSEGETLVETVETPDNPRHAGKPRVPPKRVNKTSTLVSSSLQAPSSPETTDLSAPAIIQDPEEDEELRQIEDSLQNQIKLSMLASTSSSPDLPLPPPPTNTDTEVLHTDDPLPPPPLEVTEGDFVPKNDHRSFVSETAAVPFNLSYHNSDSSNPPNSPHSIPETASLIADDSALQISQSVSKDFSHNVDDLPNSSGQPLDCDFMEDKYPTVAEVSSPVQEPCIPQQSHCHQSEKNDKNMEGVGEISKMDKDKKEEEALYANLDLLRHHMRNGDTYSCVSNGLEEIPVSAAVIVTNSATQTSDSTPSLPRKQTKVGKSQAELECERLSRDFVKSFGDAALRNLLLPSPNHKTMSDYMDGLLDLELEKGGKPTARPPSNRTAVPDHVVQTTNTNTFRDNVGLPLTSAYFTTSEPKAKLLTRYCHSLESKDWTNEVELKDKKEELIASIGKKLEILRFEQVALQDEVNQNEQLGREVTVKVQQLAKPNELEKYRLHVEELEKIINLLLSLSGRLARAQNALLILPKEAKPEERCILEAKRDKLYEQHEEARRLKESIDRRSHQVSQFLHDYLTKDEYADYEHFIKMKSKLLMDARELDEKIKLGEEQLAALRGSMDTHLWNGPTLDLHSQTIVNRT